MFKRNRMRKEERVSSLLEYKLAYKEERKKIDKKAENMIQNNDINWRNMFI